MTQKVADQHALLTRWREIADELAKALREAHVYPPDAWVRHPQHQAALRRYEEARDE